MTGNGEQLGSAIIGFAQVEELFAAHLQDEGNGGECLCIVDRRRLAIKTEGSRERRLEARLPLLAFDRFEQRSFLATDVGAVAMMGKQLEAEFRTEDLLADKTSCASFVERRFETLVNFPDFAVNIVVAAGCAHRVGSNGHTFNHRMRVVGHDVAVLESTGLTFVGIADDVFIAGERARHEGPLQAGREAGAASTTQNRFLDLGDDIFL